MESGILARAAAHERVLVVEAGMEQTVFVVEHSLCRAQK